MSGDILNDLKMMQKMVNDLPPQPREIRATKKMYYVLEREIAMRKRIDKSPLRTLPSFVLPRLWLEDDFTDWTEEEIDRGFKVVY